MQPVFIMSSERSGSNLVRRMLGAHPAVAAPPPPHLWRIFQPLIGHYGPLDVESSWRSLLEDMLAMTQVSGSHLQWKHALTVDEVVPRIRSTSLSGIAGALYESYAAREGATHWACKENNLFDHALRIATVYDQARFIYLVRDGRDVACSIRKVPTHDQHPYFIAQEWRDEQRKAIEVYEDLLPSGRCRLLRYEDLIEDPERHLRELCPWIGLEFEPAMLSFHEDRESREDAAKTEFWKNLDKPVMSSNRAKFLTELSPADVAVFESVAGPELERLGYPLAAPQKARVGGLKRFVFKVQNRRQKKAKFRRLGQERGRAERAEAMRSIQSQRRKLGKPPLAPSIRYEQ